MDSSKKLLENIDEVLFQDEYFFNNQKYSREEVKNTICLEYIKLDKPSQKMLDYYLSDNSRYNQIQFGKEHTLILNSQNILILGLFFLHSKNPNNRNNLYKTIGDEVSYLFDKLLLDSNEIILIKIKKFFLLGISFISISLALPLLQSILYETISLNLILLILVCLTIFYSSIHFARYKLRPITNYTYSYLTLVEINNFICELLSKQFKKNIIEKNN